MASVLASGMDAAVRKEGRGCRPPPRPACLTPRLSLQLTLLRLPCWNSLSLVLPDPTPTRMLPDKAELLLSVT